MGSIESEAAAALAEALADVHALHRPGARARHRAGLERLLERMGPALEQGEGSRELRLIAVQAHAARARDARHGAGQLSRSAQRAPTAEDCEDGWQRVEGLVRNAEASAREARRLADGLEAPRASEAARVAQEAADAARAIVDARNPAYTFHTDGRFSFGEGWYVAAAGVLAGIAIQLEHPEPGAVEFLHAAGLAEQLVPYRSRPCANKALPDRIARAFLRDAPAARLALRAAFLGHDGVPGAIAEWVDGRVAPGPPTVLVWVRDGIHQPTRNSTESELSDLCGLARDAGLRPILIGDATAAREVLDLTLFWKQPRFASRRAQLQLFEHLRRAHGLVGQVGVTTAGMDGPALMGLPTLYLTDAPNPRMGRWVGAVPGYEEVVRDRGYLGRVAQRMRAWRVTGGTTGA